MSELIESIRAMGRSWIFVLVAAAAAGTLTLIESWPPELVYRTESIVGVDPGAASSNDRIDFARNLQVASKAPSVLEVVAAEVGESPETIEQGLLLERIGDSNLTRVVFEHAQSDPETAEAIVTLVPEVALRFLRSATLGALTQRVGELTTVLEEAQVEADAARLAVAAAISDNANLQPDLEFEAIQEQLADLRVRGLSLDPGDDPVVASQIQEAIEELEASFPAAATRAAEFRLLNETADDANARLASFEDELREAGLELRSASIEPEVIVQQTEVPIRRVDVIIRTTLSAVVLAGALALLIAVLIRRARRGKGDAVVVGRGEEGADMEALGRR